MGCIPEYISCTEDGTDLLKQFMRSEWRRGVVVKRVTVKTPLARKVTGNHLIKSTCLEKRKALSLVSAKLEIEYVIK